MSTENIEIKQVSLGIWNQNIFVILGSDGDYFYNTQGEVRTYKTPYGALSFLKNVCEQYSRIGYIVSMPNGKTKYLGVAKDLELDSNKFGPHVWSKSNGVTIIDNSGNYDIYKCQYCGKTEKSYGLSGHSIHSGICPENLK